MSQLSILYQFEKLSKMQDMLLGVYSSTGFALCSYVLLAMHCQIMQVCHNQYHIIITIILIIYDKSIFSGPTIKTILTAQFVGRKFNSLEGFSQNFQKIIFSWI